MPIMERRGTTKGLVAFSVRITPELKHKLEQNAYEKKQSLGLTVERILEAAMRESDHVDCGKRDTA